VRRLAVSVGSPGLPPHTYASGAHMAWELVSKAAEDLALRSHPLQHWAFNESAQVLSAFRTSVSEWLEGGARESERGASSSAAFGAQVAASDAVLRARDMFLRLGWSKELDVARAYVEGQVGQDAVSEEKWQRAFAALASARHGHQLGHTVESLDEIVRAVERADQLQGAEWARKVDRIGMFVQ